MINLIIGKLATRYGLKKILLIVGDAAVKMTKSKKDDKAWKKIRGILENL